MSGSAGGNRITRMSVENTVQDYIQKVLSKFPGFKKAKATGSYNAGTKQDFGDIDLIVQIEGTDKKLIKQDLAKYFSTLPDSLIVPFKSDKYKGKKSLSSGELVTILYPIAGMSDQYVQIDNIISVSEEESTFKNTFLDYSAEVQGLLLGLAKVACLEEDPQEIFKRLGIKNIPTLELNQEYEFNLSGVGLTLRVVTLDNFKEVDRTDVWKSSNWNTVKRLFDNYNIDSDFKTLLKDLSSKLKNERSKNRIKGIFKSMVSIKSGEVGTPKGDNKQVALDAVDSILENMLFKGLVKELIMPLLEDESQETIAIYPGKFKPPHKGHFEVAKQLIGKADKIIIAISGKEVEGISAEQSKAVWELYNTLLGGKLDIIITNKSPVKYVLDTIEANPNNHYIAVHGKEDKDRYRNVGKDPRYINAEIFDGGAISSGNKIINATDLRVALANNKNISKFLPKDITPDQYEKALGMDEVVNESFYKHSIQHTIQEDINTWGTLPEYKIDLNNIYDYEKKGDFYSFYDDVNDCDIIVKLKNLPSGLVEFKFYPVKDNNILGFIKLKQINPKVMNTVYKIFQDEILTKYNSILIQPAGYTRYRLFRAMLNNNIDKNKYDVKVKDDLDEPYIIVRKKEIIKESSSIKKLRVFDFDDTLAHIDAKIYITHSDGSKESLTPAEYAVYEPKPGDTFNFKEFSSIIKKATPIKSNIDLLIKSFNTPNVKTTILTARLLGYPVVKYLKDEYGIRPYVVGLGSSDPEKKREWIEQQIDKGYNDIKFMDDSTKNINAVSKLKEKYPNVKLELKLINEGYVSKQPNDFKEALKSLTKYMIDQGMNIKPLPRVISINNDSKNAENILGKTAYYNPNDCSITLYTLNRHPKDILRSYAHEMIHRIQDNEGKLNNVNTTNTNEDGDLEKLEKEAYLKGNMTFRNWEDNLKKNINEWIVNIPKYNYTSKLSNKIFSQLHELKVNEITLNPNNAVEIYGDLNNGDFTVEEYDYNYRIIKLDKNPYNSNSFYNIDFHEIGNKNPNSSLPTGNAKENYIKILSTIYKIILDFTEKEKPEYIGISSLDESGYGNIYNNLTKTNKIPGYFRKDAGLQFKDKDGKNGKFIILKRTDV